jgi:hypothetical protein
MLEKPAMKRFGAAREAGSCQQQQWDGRQQRQKDADHGEGGTEQTKGQQRHTQDPAVLQSRFSARISVAHGSISARSFEHHFNTAKSSI